MERMRYGARPTAIHCAQLAMMTASPLQHLTSLSSAPPTPSDRGVAWRSLTGIGLAFTLAVGACHADTGGSTTPPADTTAGASTAAPKLTVPGPLPLDQQRILADITYLADDELQGRYTLSPSLETAATWIGQRYQELGLQPPGADAAAAKPAAYKVPFALTTGLRVPSPPTLELKTGARGRAIPAAAFSPTTVSGSGTATGALVFVGYAAQGNTPSSSSDADEDAGPSYDDLAGLDLKGKIAVVLLEAPRRPNIQRFFSLMQQAATDFEEAAAPLREQKDVEGLRALHKRTKQQLVTMSSPFMPGVDLAKELWPEPEDPLTLTLDLQSIAGYLVRKATTLGGPQFGPSEGSLRTKVKRLSEAGAVGVIAVRAPRSHVTPEDRKKDELPDLKNIRPSSKDSSTAIPVVQMKWSAADRYLRVGKKKTKISKLQEEIDTELTPRSVSLDGATATISVALEPIQTQVPNVLATLPGTDLADEIVIIGAHYDHIGVEAEDGDASKGHCSSVKDKEGVVDRVCNGADDNASGTAMVLELARAWVAAGVKPRRTVVFAHFAGEELGLFGSKALAESPPFELAKVKAMVNLDMVGRLGRRGLAIGGISSSGGWMPLLDAIGNHEMSVIYEGGVATRSDHANFYKKQIPVLFFFTGVHNDYHRPTDHTDKINVEGIGSIGALVSQVMLALADGYATPYQEPGPKGGLMDGLPGSDPDTLIKKIKVTPKAD